MDPHNWTQVPSMLDSSALNNGLKCPQKWAQVPSKLNSSALQKWTLKVGLKRSSKNGLKRPSEMDSSALIV